METRKRDNTLNVSSKLRKAVVRATKKAKLIVTKKLSIENNPTVTPIKVGGISSEFTGA